MGYQIFGNEAPKDKLFTQVRNAFSLGILAGLCIALGCVVNLAVGGVVGSLLFSFGLMAVILWGFTLFTGWMGFIWGSKELLLLIVSLIGNIVGCFLVGTGIAYSKPELIETAQSVINNHMSNDWIGTLFLSGMCGFIMTIVVRCGRMMPRRQLLIVILGVMLFILCGFIHSIADAGYIAMCGWDYIVSNIGNIFPFYGLIVLGNFIGGNLTRLITFNKDYGT